MRLGVTDALAMFTETCTGDQNIMKETRPIALNYTKEAASNAEVRTAFVVAIHHGN